MRQRSITKNVRRDMSSLTKGQINRLKRYACGFCELRLDRKGCGAIYEKCPEEVRQKRRDDCLSKYKPRNTNKDTKHDT